MLSQRHSPRGRGSDGTNASSQACRVSPGTYCSGPCTPSDSIWLPWLRAATRLSLFVVSSALLSAASGTAGPGAAAGPRPPSAAALCVLGRSHFGVAATRRHTAFASCIVGWIYTKTSWTQIQTFKRFIFGRLRSLSTIIQNTPQTCRRLSQDSKDLQ